MGVTELAVLFGEEWRALSDTERHRYKTKEAEDKKRYIAAMESYAPPLDDEISKKKKKKKKKTRDPNHPKRSRSA